MEAWKLARELSRNIYSVSGRSAFSRDYGLRDQVRRASVSIVSNIAEGFESQSNPSFCRFLAAARGSAAEIRAQLYVALDLDYISKSDFTNLLAKAECISRQTTGLIRYLRRFPHNK